MVVAIVLSRDSKTLAVVLFNSIVKLYDVGSGRVLYMLRTISARSKL